MSMTPDAKKLLATTIRALRVRLLADLAARTESKYQLALKAKDANLDEETACNRRRLDDYLNDQVRAQPGRDKPRDAADFRGEVEQTAAYTLLNRLVVLRVMEATGLRRQALVSQGWESPAYKTFRDLAPTLRDDESEGYELLLQLVFEELAGELPGLYGPAGPGGVADLIPVPASTLRHAIEALDQPGLSSCWTDDMTLGWVYQYWNDPEREALDAKIHGGGKIAPHEIASKTQMFTERYMVDWLLQNSLGPMWLAMCQRHDWTAEAKVHGTLSDLEVRRIDWRAKRDRGEVSLTELMPLYSDAERRWAYYVPQPIPEDAVQRAPKSVRDLKILDPAVGSGHFLVAAFELLVALYREEARHLGEEGNEDWSDKAIVEHILSDNLYGIDLDPRAVQIAAAALWLKAQQTCPEAHPRELHLVASNLRLANLPKDDPALIELRREVERETGIPGALTDKVVAALAGAEHLGSLLQVDRAVEEALDEHEHQFARSTSKAVQGEFHQEGGQGLTIRFPEQQRALIGRDEAKLSILEGLEGFLRKHTRGDDLGLRLGGEQLAAGVRFVRMVREGTYDLVIGNPPYQGTAKMQNVRYVQRVYEVSKADLYAAFLARGLQLAREGGASAFVTMRNWMFIKQYAGLRAELLGANTLRVLGDLSWGAFEEMRDNPVVMSVFLRSWPDGSPSTAIVPTDPQERVRTNEELVRKRVGMLVHSGRIDFDPAMLKVVPEWPLVYWWPASLLDEYHRSPCLGTISPAREGLTTSDNLRFRRSTWEIAPNTPGATWLPLVAGSEGRKWLEPVLEYVEWTRSGSPQLLCHESHREPSVEFRRPGPSPWRHAQDWAQLAVDRPEGAPLPEYVEQLDPEPATDHLSFALGVALGRFGAGRAPSGGHPGPGHGGPLARAAARPPLPRHDPGRRRRRGPARQPGPPRRGAACTQRGPNTGPPSTPSATCASGWPRTSSRTCTRACTRTGPSTGRSRPPNKTFVAWVNIHRMNDQTLRALLADHLLPTQARIDGELNDLRAARDGADKKAAQAAEKQYASC
jgi:hypothetical protein